MRKIVCILTKDDVLARQTVTVQKQLADCVVEAIDLNVAEPDYEKLVEAIFAADSVQVW
jgi:hypothetical protein